MTRSGVLALLVILRLAVTTLVVTAALAGMTAELTPALALACGDSPGFCPNPPDPPWTTDADGDF